MRILASALRSGLCCLFLSCVGTAHADRIFVDANLASGSDNGTSWANAFRGSTSLAAALAAAESGDEVWVADGTYFPGAINAARTATHLIPDGVRVYGGFNGGESDLAQRFPTLFVATLDGNLGRNAASMTTDNALHVVRMINASAHTVLDGFSIINGRADSFDDPHDSGGSGVLIEGGAPIVRNCIFDECNSDFNGGGLAIFGASALIEACRFRENRAFAGNGVFHAMGSTSTVRGCVFEGSPPITGSSRGLGIMNGSFSTSVDSSEITIEDCTFQTLPDPILPGGTGVGVYVSQGTAHIRRCDFLRLQTVAGGAGVSGEGTAFIDRCRFIGCEARFDGGAAIHNFNAEYTVTNSLFIGNDKQGFSTVQSGGRTRLINCTFFANGADDSFHMLLLPQGPDFVASNCIFWGNLSSTGPAEAIASTSHWQLPRLDDCLVQSWTGLLPGDRSFSSDPFFVNAVGADAVAGTIDDDLRLSELSPAIDRGNNAALPEGIVLDATGQPRRMDVEAVDDSGLGLLPIVDLGAFEVTGSACDSIDFNGDEVYPDIQDIAEFINVYGGGSCSTNFCNDLDFNNDGVYPDIDDLTAFIRVYGAGPCTP